MPGWLNRLGARFRSRRERPPDASRWHVAPPLASQPAGPGAGACADQGGGLRCAELGGVSQNHLGITLVKEYLSRDANGLVSHRNLWCAKLQSVDPKNDRCEDLSRVRFSEIEKRRGHRGLGCISRRGDHTTHCCTFSNVIGRLLGSKGRRLTYSRATEEQHYGEKP
jgi:hypothetical protein